MRRTQQPSPVEDIGLVPRIPKRTRRKIPSDAIESCGIHPTTRDENNMRQLVEPRSRASDGTRTSRRITACGNVPDRHTGGTKESPHWVRAF